MPAHVDFWFDYSCPYAYLGSTQVERLVALRGAKLRWQPMLLGGVFKANGTPQNMGGTLIPAKALHNALDMQRWADLYGVPLRLPSGHPFRTVEALRATLATDCDPGVIHGFYRAYWVEGRPPSERETLRAVVAAAGHDADAVLARIETPEIKDALRRRTEQAVQLGLFGAPTYAVDGKLYWGQDRVHFALGLSQEDVLPALPVPPGETARMPGRAPVHRAHTLELYWDFSSPFAYLASTQAETLTARTGARLAWRPVLLGGLFKEIGQPMVPIATWSEAKRRSAFEDIDRWAAYWGVPFKFPTRFPTNSLKALRCYLALAEDRRTDFRTRTFRAYWVDDRDITDDAVLHELMGGGTEAELALLRARSPVVKQALIEETQRALRAGVFGVPAWVVDDHALFWGQDRMLMVERALGRRADGATFNRHVSAT